MVRDLSRADALALLLLRDKLGRFADCRYKVWPVSIETRGSIMATHCSAFLKITGSTVDRDYVCWILQGLVFVPLRAQ